MRKNSKAKRGKIGREPMTEGERELERVARTRARRKAPPRQAQTRAVPTKRAKPVAEAKRRKAKKR